MSAQSVPPGPFRDPILIAVIRLIEPGEGDRFQSGKYGGKIGFVLKLLMDLPGELAETGEGQGVGVALN